MTDRLTKDREDWLRTCLSRALAAHNATVATQGEAYAIAIAERIAAESALEDAAVAALPLLLTELSALRENERATVRAVIASYTDRPGAGEVPWAEVDEAITASREQR